jgi:hypothetical protein
MNQTCLILLVGLWAFSLSFGIERQNHGFQLERWVIDRFYKNINSDYTSKWDIPIGSEFQEAVPIQFRNLPVSIKVVKFKQSIGFGDAIRQIETKQDFLLILGIWELKGKKKKWKQVLAKKITKENWLDYWNPISIDFVMDLDSKIKDMTIPYETIRKYAKARKKEPPFSKSVMQINPKIDSKKQRRLQCSLRHSESIKWIEGNPETLTLWGEKLPEIH